jgi:hypothetical protein
MREINGNTIHMSGGEFEERMVGVRIYGDRVGFINGSGTRK